MRARALGGWLLLRIEDIDQVRSTPENESAILEDLAWLGIRFDGPVFRQSAHFSDYRDVLDRLIDMDLVYPAFMTRGEVKRIVEDFEKDGGTWPRDPDGAPLYPDTDRNRSVADRARHMQSGQRHAFRLDVAAAMRLIDRPLSWQEETADGIRDIAADPAIWGDVVLSRSDAPSSYHLSVVVDDARQGVTNVVRGMDLFHATAIHRLLQELLGLPAPLYHHHRLILGPDGHKLSKSASDTALSVLRAEGRSPADIRVLCGI